MKIEITDSKVVVIDGVTYRKEETLPSEPKFKVGDWVYWSGVRPTLGRISGHCTEFSDSWSLSDTGKVKRSPSEYSSCSESNLRLATPSEIEAHLIAEAKRRGYREGMFLKPLNNRCSNKVGMSYNYINTFVYREDLDRLEMYGCGIYEKGKWAEIIPDKKPVPKTRDEFIFLLQDVLINQPKGYDTRASEWANSYLDQYDFND